MSSFDPPLSRSTAALLVVAAIVVFAWVLYAAHAATMAKTTHSTVESADREASAVDLGARP
jgi:hypothetical protein